MCCTCTAGQKVDGAKVNDWNGCHFFRSISIGAFWKRKLTWNIPLCNVEAFLKNTFVWKNIISICRCDLIRCCLQEHVVWTASFPYLPSFLGQPILVSRNFGVKWSLLGGKFWHFVLFSSFKNRFCDIRKNTPKSYGIELKYVWWSSREKIFEKYLHRERLPP